MASIYCINCHEEILLNLGGKTAEELLVCPKCKTSFTLREANDFLKNVSPILGGQCPSCWEELTFDIEDRISKDKLECPECNDLFFITEAVNTYTKITNQDSDREEGFENNKTIKKKKPSGEDKTFYSELGTKTSKSGIVFSIDGEKNQEKECRFCGSTYNVKKDFYCSSCGKPTLEVPKNKGINLLYDAPAELTDRAELIFSEFLLNVLIPNISKTVLIGMEPTDTNVARYSSRNIPLEVRLCNSAILYGFAIRTMEEIFWGEEEYYLPKSYHNDIKTVVKDNKFEKILPNNWEKAQLVEPLKGMLLSNYFPYYGFEDYVINTDYVESALYKAILFDSELQGTYLSYYNDRSIKESSKTMIRTGYTLGMQLSIKGDGDRELGTKSLLSNNYRNLLK